MEYSMKKEPSTCSSMLFHALPSKNSISSQHDAFWATNPTKASYMINFPSKSVSSSTKDDRNGIPSPQGLAKGRVVSCGNGCCECLWLAPEGLSCRGRILMRTMNFNLMVKQSFFSLRWREGENVSTEKEIQWGDGELQ